MFGLGINQLIDHTPHLRANKVFAGFVVGGGRWCQCRLWVVTSTRSGRRVSSARAWMMSDACELSIYWMITIPHGSLNRPERFGASVASPGMPHRDEPRTNRASALERKKLCASSRLTAAGAFGSRTDRSIIVAVFPTQAFQAGISRSITRPVAEFYAPHHASRGLA
jgi:hypothetical protein